MSFFFNCHNFFARRSFFTSDFSAFFYRSKQNIVGMVHKKSIPRKSRICNSFIKEKIQNETLLVMMSCKHSYEKMVLKMIFQNFFSIVNGPEQYVTYVFMAFN